MVSEAVRFLVTGGTIDGIDYAKWENAAAPKRTRIPGILRQGRVEGPIEIEVLARKDSRFITDDDRKRILKRCLQCPEKRIVITHGTITMTDTAKYLGNRISGKTVVLVGSFVFPGEKNTDAVFNVGFALAAVLTLPHGVYIATNGEIFKWNDVRKNEDHRVFERLKKG